MNDDRRTGLVTRRSADVVDWLLDSIERDMAKMSGKIEMLEAHCSDDRLDRRFVPRAEHEARFERSRDWGLRLLMVAVAVAQIAEAVILAGIKGH